MVLSLTQYPSLPSPLASLSLFLLSPRPSKYHCGESESLLLLDVHGSRGRRHNDSGNNTPRITVNTDPSMDPESKQNIAWMLVVQSPDQT